MIITLEKIDQIIERTNVSYNKAKEALEAAEGDVLDAILAIECSKTHKDRFSKNINDFGNNTIKALKELLKAGNVNRIIVEQKEGRIIMNIPVSLGAIGAFFLTSATVIGLIAALGMGCVIKIHKESGEIINVNERAGIIFGHTKEKATEVYEKTKEKATEVKHKHEHEQEDLEEENSDDENLEK